METIRKINLFLALQNLYISKAYQFSCDKMAQKHKSIPIIPRVEKDNFRNFRGFAPEGKYESFSRDEPVDAAKSILRRYVGKTVDLEYYPVGAHGIAEKFIDGFILYRPEAVDMLFEKTNTDFIRISFHDCETEGYILQRIVDRDQSVTQIERTW